MARNLLLWSCSVAVLLQSAVAQPLSPNSRSECAECKVESNGPAALSKEVVLRALPPITAIQSRCPLSKHESTMFLSPFQTGIESTYFLHLSFLFGDQAESISHLSTLYTSYFTFEKDPSQSLLQVNYLAMQNNAWAQQIAAGLSRAPVDKASALAAGRYVILVRPGLGAEGQECFSQAKELFLEQFKTAVNEIGPESYITHPELDSVLRVQGTVLDTLKPLSEEAFKALTPYYKSLYVVMASSGVQTTGSAGVGTFTNLEVLSLGPTNLLRADTQAISGLAKLRALHIGSCNVTDEMLADISLVSSLEHLSLRANPVTDRGVKNLQKLPKLQHLSLAKTQISDVGLEILGKIDSLRWLFLNQTSIGDKGLKHLGNLKNLEYLSLAQTQVSDESLELLGSLPKLRELSVVGSRITEAGATKLHASRKGKLKVRF